MDSEYFDALLNQAYNESVPQQPSLSEQKNLTVEEKYQQKLNRIADTSSATIQNLEDGDSGTFVGGLGFRQKGIDTYETYHPGKYNAYGELTDPKDINRMERQRQRYAQQFNVPLEQVKYEDIYEQGAKAGLQNLYNMTRDGTTQPWTPGDTSYYRNHPLELGNKENPLDIVIQQKGYGVGKFGRQISDIYNPNTFDNVSEQALNGFNAALYKANGNFDRAATNAANARAGGVNGGIPLNRALTAEEAENVFGQSGGDGRIMTDLKIIGKGVAHVLSHAMDYGAEKIADAAVALGAADEAGVKAAKDFWNDDSDVMKWVDEAIGVNKKYNRRAQKQLQNAIANGNYGQAAMSVLQNLDIHLANSLPEILPLALGAPGLALVVVGRTQDQKNDFIKENGYAPSAGEEVSMMATNAAVLLFEGKLIAGPMKKVFGSIAKKAEPGVVAAFKEGKSVGEIARNAAKGIAGSTAGETTQEILDQAQENYWRRGGSGNAEGLDAFTRALELAQQGKVLSADEAISAGIAGGVMGGALRGAGEAKLAAAEVPAAQRRVRQQEAGEFLTGDNAELQQAVNDSVTLSHDQTINKLNEGINEVNNAQTFDDLKKSKNEEIAQTVKRIIKEQSPNPTNPGSQTFIDTVKKKAAQIISDNNVPAEEKEKVYDAIAKDTEHTVDDLKEMSNEEIANVIQEKSVTGNNDLLDIVSPDTAFETRMDLIGNEEFDNIKKTVGGILNANKSKVEYSKAATASAANNINKGLEKSPKEGRMETVTEGGVANEEEIQKIIDEIDPKVDEALYNDGDISNFSEELQNVIKDVNENRKIVEEHTTIVNNENATDAEWNAYDAAVEKYDESTKNLDEAIKAEAALESVRRNPPTAKQVKVEGFGTKDEIIDTKSLGEKLNTKNPLKKIAHLFGQGKVKELVSELNKYSADSLKAAMNDKATPSNVKRAIKLVQAKRKKAVRTAGIGKETITTLNNIKAERGNKKQTMQAIHRLVKAKNIKYTEDSEQAHKIIDSALEQGFITEEQARIFKKRIDKLSKEATTRGEDTQAEAEKKRKKDKSTLDKEEELNQKIEITEDDYQELENEARERLDEIDREIDKRQEALNTTEDEKEKANLEKEINELKLARNKLAEKKAKAIYGKYRISEQDVENDEKYSAFDNDEYEYVATNKPPLESLNKTELAILNNICK